MLQVLFFQKNLRLLISILIVLVLPAFVLSCGRGGSRVEQALNTRIYHVDNASEPQSLDPHVSSGVTEQRIQWALFEGLVTMNSKDLSPLPGVAERWEISEDLLNYRFYLRKNAKWSNGDPITAEDFRWSWQRALSPKTGTKSAYMLYPIKNSEAFLKGDITDFNQVGVRVIDNYTLEVELGHPAPYFLQILDHHTAAPVHRATIEKFGGMTDRFTGWTRPENMISNGPFTLKSWAINRHVKVEKNDQYWDKENVWLEGIVYYPIENYAASERIFRANQLHQTYEMLTDKVATYRKDRPEALRVNPYIGSYYYQINTTRKPFDDKRVRHALALAIDREALINTALSAVNSPSYAIVPPGTLGYQPPKLFEFDPEQARKLLAEAGFPNGEGFPKFELLYNTNDTHRKVAEVVQQMWNKHLNIEAELTNQEWKVYLDSRQQKFFDVSRAGWIGDYVDPDSFISLWLTESGNNDTGWGNKEYDHLVKNVIPIAKTQQERFDGFYKAETILMNDMPFIPIFTYETKYLMHETVKGSPPNIMDKFNYKQIYLEAVE